VQVSFFTPLRCVQMTRVVKSFYSGKETEI
jgi:hypothetical protein